LDEAGLDGRAQTALLSIAAARAPRRVSASRQIDGSDLARLIRERLDARARETPAQQASPCVLLLIRLTAHDGPRVVLPTVSARTMLAVLRSRLASVLQAQDRYSIIGSNEVLVFLNRVRSEGIARLAMARLLQALGPTATGKVTLSPAIGGAIPSPETSTAEQLAAIAEAACVTAGQSEGRLHLVVGGATVPDHSDLVHDLRLAIETNQLEVHYQPQLNFDQRRCLTMEALVRWPRPAGRKPVMPDVVVDIACRHGLIQALTRFVLNTALREARDLARRGHELGVAVNLAPVLFGDPHFPATVAQALSVWNFPARLLTLEVTESSDLQDTEAALLVMQRLRTLGTRLSIDDFGTGFSSLARLRAMPLAELKIDRLFVANMNASQADLQIVRSVIDLAHNFELEVVAEGVEDPATARHLRGLGCDAIQGYLFARPMGIEKLRGWLDAQPDIASLLED
jgi:EAL domain-containing protein (putative c-di-GMP-specific phosphodiesterase class I)